MRRITLIIILFVNIIKAGAQRQNIQPLKFGDTIPDLNFEMYVGDSVHDIHLKEYKGKLLLLDFWGVDCPVCIADMPKMLKLQEKFKDEVQIVLVTKNKREDVESLWTKLKAYSPNAEELIYAGRHLPFIYSDSTLSLLIPHMANPLHAWIDQDQLYRALTYAVTTTPENIRGFLKGDNIRLANYKMPPGNFELSDPASWVENQRNMLSFAKSYSFITGRVEKGGLLNNYKKIIDPGTHKITGVYIMNKSVLDLYKLACFKGLNTPDYQVLLEVKHPSDFYNPEYDDKYYDWADSNMYCYALKLPPTEPGVTDKIMQGDLDRFFRLSSSFGHRKIKCLVIKRTSSVDKLHSTHEESVDGVIRTASGMGYKFQNEDFDNVVEVLQDQITIFCDPFLQLINETNYKGKVDAEIPYGQTDISIGALARSLRRYGLEIVEEYRIKRVLVISDARPGGKK